MVTITNQQTKERTNEMCGIELIQVIDTRLCTGIAVTSSRGFTLVTFAAFRAGRQGILTSVILFGQTYPFWLSSLTAGYQYFMKKGEQQF